MKVSTKSVSTSHIPTIEKKTDAKAFCEMHQKSCEIIASLVGGRTHLPTMEPWNPLSNQEENPPPMLFVKCIKGPVRLLSPLLAGELTCQSWKTPAS
jgi:hypothetical protein